MGLIIANPDRGLAAEACCRPLPAGLRPCRQRS